ncbi:MAG: glycosyltransferase family 1 protein [Candidatus Berkelbacteria bacterium]|nr:glycosyltransferase family 1 protein [Candidatus Berkelbacteria bacterium]
MIIGIDASRSNVKQKTGTEYYSYEIIKNLILSNEDNFRLYSKTKLDYLEPKPNVENKVMKFPKLWSQVRLSFEMIKNPPDVLFEPAHTIPVFHPKKTVVTLHDVGFKYFPQLYTPLERYYHNFSMGFSVKHATKIIAISEATKKDLMDIYNADEKRISVIYHGFDKEKYYPLKQDEKISEKIIKLKPYIYFIGRLEAKKNIVNLIKAYGILRENPEINHKLVLAGRPGYQYEEIKEEVLKLPLNIQKDVIEPGYILDEEVSEYMRNGSIFAFPSRFEGFGMPLVEAMASGVPIVASNTTSIPEIVSDAGLLCSPDDYQKIASNLEKIISSNGLRVELIEKGLKRSKIFDWEIASKKTLEVIKSA